MDDSAFVDHAEGDRREADGLGQLLSLKDGDAFIVADANGDILGAADGFFDDDTRLLSRFRLLVGERSPSGLGSAVSRDNVAFTFHGANRPLPVMGQKATPPGVMHVERRRFLWDRRLYERVRVTNHSLDDELLPLAIEFDADFRDMFEIRGVGRAAHGKLAAPAVDGRRVIFGYRGLDEIERSSVIAFSEPPARISARRAEFLFSLSPRFRFELYVEVGASIEEPPSRERFRAAAAAAIRAARKRRRQGARIRARGPRFNAWLDQSRADLAFLTTNLPTGPYPYAGIPWFSTPFGRDGVITAWQMLWLDPGLARGVLRYLAARQAHEVSAFRDAAPGKIMHETRSGEMSNTCEVPFGLYYGSVDSTPLFVALAGAYAERTGDLDLIRELWPALTAALGWIETYGDSNGDGLIDYARGERSGLANQGWKDSEDAIFHGDGRFPDGPIALVEVQGYAFAAFRGMAGLGMRLGDERSAAWAARAEAIRAAVEARFWMEDEGFYGIAIDGEGRLCRPLASNAGHLLFVGLPAPERAERVRARLLSPDFDTGWGLRTLASSAVRFNPMSYHNGSVWPHDTAICAAGLSRYGHRAAAASVLDSLGRAATKFNMRLPELFCGFARGPGEPPIAYPVACMPQAWAAGSVFMLLEACLGLSIDGWAGRLRLANPQLPQGVDRLTLNNLAVGSRRVDLIVSRTGEDKAPVTVLCSAPDLLDLD
ncbi:MAG TPA: amylo-alpha-1,6-glucosidase [Caulobacteraceae bacterium]|nr:amylo-alpha-1,6-glucosidase [Caulobacteraceae bacterium]